MYKNRSKEKLELEKIQILKKVSKKETSTLRL